MTRTDIATMPVAERLQLMEALWESLDEDSSAAVPDWHAEVLAERAIQHEQGREEAGDWEEAKQRIRSRIAPR
jgi:putative addiction module component (TIGR02574 family)